MRVPRINHSLNYGTAPHPYLSLSVESPSATDPKFAVEVASDAPVRIRHTVADASTKVVVGPYVIGALRSRCGRRVIECDGAKVGAKIMT